MLEKYHPGKSGLKLEILTWLDLFKKKTWRRTAVGMRVAFFQQVRCHLPVISAVRSLTCTAVFW